MSQVKRFVCVLGFCVVLVFVMFSNPIRTFSQPQVIRDCEYEYVRKETLADRYIEYRIDTSKGGVVPRDDGFPVVESKLSPYLNSMVDIRNGSYHSVNVDYWDALHIEDWTSQKVDEGENFEVYKIGVESRLFLRPSFIMIWNLSKPEFIANLKCYFPAEANEITHTPTLKPSPPPQYKETPETPLVFAEPKPDNPFWWLLDFWVDPITTTELQVHVDLAWTSDYDSFRICFDGENCQETSATSLEYFWNVTGLPSGEHILTVEYRQLSDNGDWGNALSRDFPYELGDTTAPNPYPWLLNFSSAENLPLGYTFDISVDGSGDFSSFRLCFDGTNCQETASTQLTYEWDTSGWSDGQHTISVEYRRTTDNNWSTGLKFETPFYLSEIRGSYVSCGTVQSNTGATLTSGNDCIGVIESVADLMPVHWEKRPDLQVCSYGVDSWVYDGTLDNNGNFNGIARVVPDGTCRAVGSNISSVDLKDPATSALPVPIVPFSIDSDTLISHSFNGNAIANAGSSGTVVGTANFVPGIFDEAISMPAGDGSGITFPVSDFGCSFTLDTWVALNPSSSNGRIASQLGGGGNTGSNKWLFSVDNGGRFVWEQWTNTGSTSMTSYFGIPKDNTWHYVSVNYDCSTQVAVMSVDNVEAATLNAAGSIPSGSTTLEIGMGEGIYSCNCMIDEFRVRSGVHQPETDDPTSSSMNLYYSDPSAGEITANLQWENGGDVTQTIDWGDGSDSTMQGGSGNQTLTHNYAPGTYTAQFKVTGKNNISSVISETFVIPSFGCGDNVILPGAILFVYKNCSTAGGSDRFIVLGAGKYNLSDLGVDDSISAIHIPSDGSLSVRLYKDANWTGESYCAAWDMWNFELDIWPDGSLMNNSISSIEVFESGDCTTPTPTAHPDFDCGSVPFTEVGIFDEKYCKGSYLQLAPGFYNLTDLTFNDLSSAIYVPAGSCVEVYEHIDGAGESRILQWSYWDFSLDTWPNGSGMDNVISSIAVFNNGDCIPSTPTPMPTPTSTSISSDGVELLSAPLILSAASEGDEQSVNQYDPNVLVGKDIVRITYDLHGLCALGGDASAFVFNQSEWMYISLSDYGTNCMDGIQTVDVPLLDFWNHTKTVQMQQDTTIAGIRARFWYSSPYFVEILSAVAMEDNATSPTATPTATPTASPVNDFIIINSTLPGYEAIYKAETGGTNWLKLAGDGSGSWKHAGYPRVSPDGQFVAYEAHNGLRYLWIVDINGNNKQQLYSSPIHHARIVWAPDSSKILFIGEDNVTRTIEPDGSNLTVVPGWPTYYKPTSWCSNGKILAHYYLSISSDNNIFSLNPDGSEITQLTFDSANDTRGIWSPDCSKIVFQSNRTGQYEIWIMDADGSNQTQLTFTPNGEWSIYPIWSPDGNQILFSSSRDTSGYWDLFTMSADGSNVVNITNTGEAEQWSDWGQ